MARSYQIVVSGADHAVQGTRREEARLAIALAEASEEVSRVLERRLTLAAPQPKSRSETKGSGVFARFEGRKRRFAGVDRQLIYSVAVGVKDPSVAAFVEFGTGIYAEPARKGPLVGYEVRAEGKALHPFQTPEGRLFRKSAFIRGTRPHPFVHDTVNAAMPRVDEIYRTAVDRALR